MSTITIPNGVPNPRASYLLDDPVVGVDRIRQGKDWWIWVKLVRFRRSVPDWHNFGCPAFPDPKKPEDQKLKLLDHRVSGVGQPRQYMRETDAAAIEKWYTEPDPLTVNIPQAEAMGFRRGFLLKYSDRWHPADGEEHPMLRRWIRGTFGPDKEKRFCLKDLQELKKNFDLLKEHKATVAADPDTIEAIELAKLAGVDRSVIHRWEDSCPYSPETGKKLKKIGSRLAPTKNGAVEPVAVYRRRDGETAADRFKQAKAGIYRLPDPSGKEADYLSWANAMKRLGKPDPSMTHSRFARWAARRLKELVDAGIVHRQRAPGWGYRSKHGPKPWAFNADHIDSYVREGRVKRVDPETHEAIPAGEKERRRQELEKAKLQPHWFDDASGIDGLHDWYEEEGALKIAGCSTASLNNWTPDRKGVVHHWCPHLPSGHKLACIRRHLENRTPPVRRLWLGDDVREIERVMKGWTLPRQAPTPPNGVHASEQKILGAIHKDGRHTRAHLENHITQQHVDTRQKLTKKPSTTQPHTPFDNEVFAVLTRLGVSATDLRPYDWEEYVKRNITGDDLKTAKSQNRVRAEKINNKNHYNVADVIRRWWDRFSASA